MASGDEFHESDLFLGSDEEDDTIKSAGLSSDDEREPPAAYTSEPESDTRPGLAGSSVHMGRSQSNLRPSALDEIAEEETADAPFNAPGGMNGMFGSVSAAATRNMRMGSSVPVSIPGMPLFKQARTAGGAAPGGADMDAPQAPQYPATFVPPHKLSQQNASVFSVNGGASPGTLLKRDRLKMRNAVLQSTGFLESSTDKVEVEGDLSRKSIRKGDGGMSQAFAVPRDFPLSPSPPM